MNFKQNYMAMTEEERELFQDLQNSAVLPTLAHPGEGDLAKRHRAQRKEELKKKLEPYADVLEAQVRPTLLAKKEQILAQLEGGQDFTVQLCEWNFVTYRSTPNMMRASMAEMTSEERAIFSERLAERDAYIANQGWSDSLVEVRATHPQLGEVTTLPPQKLMRIFTKTNLLWRIASALGPNFTPYIVSEAVSHVGHPRDALDFVAMKSILCVKYCPAGLQATELKKLLTMAKDQKRRRVEDSIRVLSLYEQVSHGLRWCSEIE